MTPPPAARPSAPPSDPTRMPPNDLSAAKMARLDTLADAAVVEASGKMLALSVGVLDAARALVRKYGYGSKAGRADYMVSMGADELEPLTQAVQAFDLRAPAPRSGDGDPTPPLTPEQCEAGLAEAERIIRRSAGYYFGGSLVEFAPEFQSLALAALASQRAARARAEEDTARLDWLNERREAIEGVRTVGRQVGDDEWEPEAVRELLGYQWHGIEGQCETIREAIDAARASETVRE